MITENKKRTCEICGVEIPEDFANALCVKCYTLQVEEMEQKKKEEADNLKKEGRPTQAEALKRGEEGHCPVKGIDNPNYSKNPLQEQINQVERNYTQYIKSGKWLWTPTRTMYEFIKDSFRDIVVNHPQYPKFVWKPTVVDIGCGSGLGTNILSQEADFVWGIDKNPNSVHFANEMFKRNKNNIYYTSEIRFDTIDIESPPPNVEMKFDTVVAIEVFEHLEDYEKLLVFAKSIMRPNSMFWASSPNRNNQSIADDKPKNKYHTIEMTQEEFVKALSQHFGKVELFNSVGDPVGDNNTHTPLLALATEPKL